MIKLLSRKPTALRLVNPSAAKIKILDRKSGSAGMPRPISYAVFCLKKKRSRILRHTLFYSLSGAHRELHSFPTRRSSDLGAEEAGVTEVRTSLSEKKFELWREIKV